MEQVAESDSLDNGSDFRNGLCAQFDRVLNGHDRYVSKAKAELLYRVILQIKRFEERK